MNEYKQRAMKRLFGDEAMKTDETDPLSDRVFDTLVDMYGYGRMLDNFFQVWKKDYEACKFGKLASDIHIVQKFVHDKLLKRINSLAKDAAKLYQKYPHIK